MFCPAEVIWQPNSQVLKIGYFFQEYIGDGKLIHRLWVWTLSWYDHILALRNIKLQIVLWDPSFHGVNVLLKELVVTTTLNLSIEEYIVSIYQHTTIVEWNLSNPIHVYEEQKGAQNRTLWDPWDNVGRGRRLTINNNILRSETSSLLTTSVHEDWCSDQRVCSWATCGVLCQRPYSSLEKPHIHLHLLQGLGASCSLQSTMHQLLISP